MLEIFFGACSAPLAKLLMTNLPSVGFRDANFSIWAHLTAQCVPEQGDWYARRMYLQGNACYDHHLKTCSYATVAGFMEIDNL